ncbi:MAG TPA: hypothetical protein VD997_17020 [Phycisphaerales bacterium]|nr:hypothetical protein [Phycisphaerales bacterium]
MPRHDDELDEDPSPEDLERFGGATRTCPECRTELYDDSEVCWKCGHHISNRPKEPKTWVIIVAVGLVVLILGGYLWSVVR